MKHSAKITLILLSMFIITQFIGLYVVNHYNQESNTIPYGMEVYENEVQSSWEFFPSLIIAFILAIILVYLFTRFKFKFIMKLWFFVVVIIALGITLNSIVPEFKYSPLIILATSFIFAFIKIYKQNFIVHNATEFLVYPGIAAVFVSILNFWSVIILLIIISLYDMWAVWKSGIMQKMAKYQMDTLKIFPGFFVPYISKKLKEKLKKLKKSELKKKKIKINVAILGGGDIIFPIITAGVIMQYWGILGGLFVIAGATLGLGYLFLQGEKEKFYPAMPFITAGIFLGMILFRIIF